MELIIFSKLSRESQAAMKRHKSKYGQSYQYEPNGRLLHRLARITGMSLTQVREQIIKERNYLIQNDQ